MTDQEMKEINKIVDKKLEEFKRKFLSSKSKIIVDTATEAEQVINVKQSIGTKITDKLGFYGKTPRITQQANTAGSVTAPATYTATARAMLNDCYSVLRNLGLLS